MTILKTVPILRIFDYQKALEFYVDWLGFEVMWEHRFEENMPVYLEVTKGDLTLHLSEHHGDASPHSKVYINCTGLKEYHSVLREKKYPYNKPGLQTTFYNTLCMEVIDPFSNRLSFNEAIDG